LLVVISKRAVSDGLGSVPDIISFPSSLHSLSSTSNHKKTTNTKTMDNGQWWNDRHRTQWHCAHSSHFTQIPHTSFLIQDPKDYENSQHEGQGIGEHLSKVIKHIVLHDKLKFKYECRCYFSSNNMIY